MNNQSTQPCTNLIAETADSLQKIANNALKYLSRRDYSCLELYQKLIAKGFDIEDIQSVLENLQKRGYQSDERFTEMFIRSRMASGDGPFKIKIALRGKGICDSLALTVMDKLNVDWFEQAKKIKTKRFGDQVVTEPKELAKQIRYLKGKGFYQDHINAVIEYTH